MTELHHVGWLVKRIETAAEDFEKLGFVRDGEICKDESRGVDILFMTCGSQKIELVCPFRKDSDVSALMVKHKNAPYHVCMAVDDLEHSIMDLEKKGFSRISKTSSAPAINGKKVVFLISSEMGLVELLDNSGDRK